MHNVKIKMIITVIILSFAFDELCNAQIQPKRFKDNYKVLAQKETSTMKTRYQLNSTQLQKVEKLNQVYYAEISNVLETNKDRRGRKEAVRLVREKREQQLKGLFTKAQYGAYRKDMDAVELKAQQHMDALNKNIVRERLRPIK